MNGDFTRSTYDRSKHYQSVRMQQGRVQTDADHNEQIDIGNHRIETEALDLIGPSGAPLHHDGFRILASLGTLTAAEQARRENKAPPPIVALQPQGDFYISGGRYYVDGILCQNDHIFPYTNQPDLPGTKPLTQAGVYFAYLDVWGRHITALDDKHIREVALNGPDTATRVKTLAQVKLLRIINPGSSFNCLSNARPWDAMIAPSAALLKARAEPDGTSKDPCVIEPGAGYRRLENQLYRVEIDQQGGVGVATYKWSRDNGSIVTSWVKRDGDDLTVGSMGRDTMQRFAPGKWIELSDDTLELNRLPGTLVQIVKAQGQIIKINPATATGPLAFSAFPKNPKVRHWDGTGKVAIPPASTGTQGYIGLEDGVQIRFEAGAIYKTGDYWTIPARTATEIEWPRDAANAPLAIPPEGIQHHYCRLAVLEFDGTKFTKITDCRNLFPPVTELTSFFYLSGDGQEATPDPATPLLPLAQPLRVGVANGEWPVAGARVEFKILSGGPGQLQGAASPAYVLTGADGVATCAWKLDSANASQQVEARLLDALDNTVHLPVRFNANLSRASEVSYDPAKCTNLAGIKTVQAAIDILCKLDHGEKCCCVTVGKDTVPLDETLKKLLETEADICICLLPGDHKLGGFSITGKNPHINVHIHGCGRGSRIRLSKQLVANKLDSLALQDLSILVGETADRPIRISECSDVTITGCHIKQSSGRTDLLTIGGAQRIHIADNLIESSWISVPEVAESAGVETGGVGALGGSFAGPGAVEAIASHLAGKRKSTRVAFADSLAGMVKAAPLSKAEKKVAAEAVKRISALAGSAKTSAEFATALKPELTRFLLAPALVIADARAETAILNNLIFGEVRFYGESEHIKPEAFDKIALQIKGKVLLLDRNLSTVRIQGNICTNVVVDSNVKSADVFGRMSLLDNTFHMEGSQWLAAHVISNGNHFRLPAKRTAATAKGASFICVGTSARGSSLRYAVPNPAAFSQSANLIEFEPPV
jgi:hypothetical protein